MVLVGIAPAAPPGFALGLAVPTRNASQTLLSPAWPAVPLWLLVSQIENIRGLYDFEIKQADAAFQVSGSPSTRSMHGSTVLPEKCDGEEHHLSRVPGALLCHLLVALPHRVESRTSKRTWLLRSTGRLRCRRVCASNTPPPPEGVKGGDAGVECWSPRCFETGGGGLASQVLHGDVFAHGRPGSSFLLLLVLLLPLMLLFRLPVRHLLLPTESAHRTASRTS